MTTLVPGGNTPIATGSVRVDVACTPIPGADIDFSAFALTSAGTVRSDSDMCFYGQPQVLDGALQLIGSVPGSAGFIVDLSRLDATVEKVALAATVHEGKACFDRVSALVITVTGGATSDGAVAPISTVGMKETALILGEFYRRQGAWKFRCVAQGFAGGLEPLAKHFGVDIATPPASIPPVPVVAHLPDTPLSKPPLTGSKPDAVVNLSKVTLDKYRSTISLEKTPAGFGEIRVNLNWNKSEPTGGWFTKSKAIDLDVGCLFELQDGTKGAVQALGESFGQLEQKPFIQLMGDDRSGSVAGGEWLHINGRKWSDIRRVLIFAFIYDGAPNWRETDGVVTLFIPGQPEIEVRLNEEGGRLGMCAIAMLENDNGAVKVTRRVDFHKSHEPMDRSYQWGMRWSAGSK